MTELLQRKLDRARDFRAATEELISCIHAENDEAVPDLVLRRQACIEEIDRIDHALAGLPSRGDRGAAALQADIRKELAAAYIVEKECGAALKSRVAALQDEIARLQRGRTGFQAYGQERSAVSRLCGVRT